MNQERKTNIFRIILSHNQTFKKKKIFLGNLFCEKYLSQKHNFRPNKLMISVADVMGKVFIGLFDKHTDCVTLRDTTP